MTTKIDPKSEVLTYKNKPLTRCENTIYYGSIYDKYIIKMEIKSVKKKNDMDVADEVTVQLIDMNPDVRGKKKVIKTSEKPGLYLALDIADVWLERALEDR